MIQSLARVSRAWLVRSMLLLPLAASLSCSAQATTDTHESRTAGAADGGGASGRGGNGNREAVPVAAASVVEKAMSLDIPAVGAGEAISSVQVRAQTTGQLGEIHFAEGQDVQKGQLLFQLDPRPFQLALQQTQAVLARDTAQALNAQKEVERYKPLLDRGLIPREQFDSTVASATAAQATTGADEAAVETAKLNLEYTRISAPISGRAGSLTVHTGDLIRANDTIPMVVINQIAPINVTFAVPGKLLDQVREFQAHAPLRVTADVGADHRSLEGHVTFIDNAVDPTSGTIKLKALFNNQTRDVWPGQFVNVSMQLTTDPHAIVAPAAAVQASQNGQYVYVVKSDQTVKMRSVTVERTVGADAIMSAGLKAGETVVTDGQLRLTPGTRVSIRPDVTPTGATK
jgi:multidrug efflux system membrane fusion protein